MQISEQDVIIAGGASALVALARKRWPKIDGGWVWVAMFVAALALAGIFEALPLLHPQVAKIIGVALAAITVVTGGKGALAQLALSARSKLVEPPSPDKPASPALRPSADAVMIPASALPSPPSRPTPQTGVVVDVQIDGVATRPVPDLNFSGDPKP